MGARFERRIPMKVSVRIMGVSAGKAFNVEAQTLDVTTIGVRLEGVAQPLQCGDIVTLQHKTNRARYRVVWIGKDGHASHIGLRLADPGKSIWGKPLARILGDDYSSPAT